MCRNTIIALALCLGLTVLAAPGARAAPPIAAGIADALPAPAVEAARYYRVYYVRRRYYRRRFYRPRYYYRPRYHRYRYYRPYHYRRRFWRFY